MQRPIYKNDIYRSNISNNPKKIRVKIGDVPAHLSGKEWDANIIIINENKLCDYSIPVDVPSGIFPLLKINPYFDFNDSEIKSTPYLSARITDSIHVELNYQRSQKQFFALDQEKFYRLLAWSQFIKKVDVTCFASVEGATWFNIELLEGRKQTVYNLLTVNQFDPSQLNIQTSENWSEMTSQIQHFSIEPLKHKTHAQIKYYLKNNKSQFLDSLLFTQRKTHVYATIDTTITLTNFDEFKFASYYDSTLFLKSLPLNKILREDYILVDREIERSLVDSLKSNTELKTNLLGAVTINNVTNYLDSATVTELLTNLDTSISKQVFNFAHFVTKYWFSSFSSSYETKAFAKTITPNQLLTIITNIDTTIIETRDLNRLNINILLAGIHYYVAHNNWNLVDDYFNAISDYVKQNNFTAQEAVELALFCNHFYKFEVAVTILRPFHEDKLLSEDGCFVLAQTATLIRSKLDQTNYRDYMNAAKQANLFRYCNWLDRSFQIQRDEFIKDDFCRVCK